MFDDIPTLPNGWRFLESEEDPQASDLVWDEASGWRPATPDSSPKKQLIIRKTSSSASARDPIPITSEDERFEPWDLDEE